MAGGVSSSAADSALSAIVGDWVAVQLHTADPGTAGTTGASTFTGSPYRATMTWGSPSGGVINMTNEPAWTNWSSSTVPETETYISGWSSATQGAGTYGGAIALSASVTMNTGDSLTLTSASITMTLVS